MSGGEAAVRMRKERVHTTMLIELLALLVFLALAYAFVSKDDSDRLNPWKTKYDESQRQLKAAKVQINGLLIEVNSLKQQVADIAETLRRFARDHKGTVASNDQLLISKDLYAIRMRELANAKAVAEQRQRENADLRDRLSGKGGSDLPNCAVSPGAFIAAIELLPGDRYRVRPLWPESSKDAARDVDGLASLTGGRELSASEFIQFAQQVENWGDRQSPPCKFRVTVARRHSSLPLFERQLSVVEQRFYPARRP